MCPSFQATRDEKDSTRARARVLQDAMEGHLGTDPFAAPELIEVLDLCLSCRGCSSDCPTGVDMATYKSEVLHQKYSGKLRPRSHYTLGRLPTWGKLAGISPAIANAVLASPLGSLLKRGAGVDVRRALPKFTSQTLRKQFTSLDRTQSSRHGQVMLWCDPFTDRFAPEVGMAAARVLQSAGYDVHLSPAAAGCALTWISTGQLDKARSIAAQTVSLLLPTAQAGVRIVGLEPSSTAVLRSDINHLLGTSDARTVSAATVTLAELLTATPDWTPPDLGGIQIVAQPHCHQHAVMGWDSDAALLRQAGATVTRVPGCCGLAGNWGMEQGHYDVSVAVAESNLLPAVRAASSNAIVLADGFSCRTQLDDLASQPAQHLAQLLDR
jgi:Fe-S oxidoreductase